MNDERGASAVEYALLLAGIAGVLIVVIFALGTNTGPLFQNTCDSFSNEVSTGSSC